jgi:hypothetical protein
VNGSRLTPDACDDLSAAVVVMVTSRLPGMGPSQCRDSLLILRYHQATRSSFALIQSLLSVKDAYGFV